jgi:hypothetical protein
VTRRLGPFAAGELATRHPWLFALGSLVFWTVLWPVAVLWCLWYAGLAWRGPGATREDRRVARLLRWYPRGWRERYGDEFSELLRESLRDGRRVWLDVVRSGIGERLRGDRVLTAACLSLCWIPIFPQGVVALIMTVTGAPSRSWFLALYVPGPYQRLVAGAMILLGLALLAAGLRAARADVENRTSAPTSG